MHQKKIVIIGAGPAGSSTAHYLGRHQIAHTLLDKAVFPRPKVCGDGIAPRGSLMLDRINPTIRQKHGKLKPIYGGRVFAPNGQCTNLYLKKPDEQEANAFSIPRVELDHLLTQQIDTRYTDFQQGVEIKQIRRHDQGFVIDYQKDGQALTLEADILIGCDGDRSIVKKTFAPQRMDPDHYVAGIRTYYSGVKGMHKDQFFEFYFLKELLPGYLWIFPLGNGSVNVGLGMLSSDVSARKANLREILQTTLAEHPVLAERFADARQEGKLEGWGLPLGSKMGTLSGDGFLLTGDAASLIDPLTGEGVGNALFSGWLAADAVAKAVEEGRTDAAFFAKHYDKRLRRCIGRELRGLDWLSRLFSSPRLLNYILSQINSRAFLQDTINSLYDPALIRKKVRNPLFFPKLLWNLVAQ